MANVLFPHEVKDLMGWLFGAGLTQIEFSLWHFGFRERKVINDKGFPWPTKIIVLFFAFVQNFTQEIWLVCKYNTQRLVHALLTNEATY